MDENLEKIKEILERTGRLPLSEEMLDKLVADLPDNPPYPGAEGKDITISDLHPDLLDEEMDYIVAHYKGNMKR